MLRAKTEEDGAFWRQQSFCILVVGGAFSLDPVPSSLAECSAAVGAFHRRVLDALDIISVDDLTQKSTWDSHTHRSMSVVARGAPGG